MRRNPEFVKLPFTALLIAVSIVLNYFLGTYISIGGLTLVKIGFQSVPVMICSLVCGPFYGAICGFASDFIPAIAFPVGPYFPGFTIDAIFFGVLPSLVLKHIKNKKGVETIISCSLIVIASIALFFTLPQVDEIKLEGGDSIMISSLLKILIPIIFLLVTSTYLVIAFFTSKKSKGFTPLDILISYFLRDFTVRIFLAPLWLYQLYQIPYAVSLITQTLTSLITMPIYILICYFLLVPLSIVAKDVLNSTYSKGKVIYTKILNGKPLKPLFF